VTIFVRPRESFPIALPVSQGYPFLLM